MGFSWVKAVVDPLEKGRWTARFEFVLPRDSSTGLDVMLTLLRHCSWMDGRPSIEGYYLRCLMHERESLCFCFVLFMENLVVADTRLF